MRVERRVIVPVPTDVAFAVMETGLGTQAWVGGRAHFLDGATEAAQGVRCEARMPPFRRMVMEYTAYQPPHKAVVKVIRGPWIVPELACGMGFSVVAGGTEVTVRYSLSVRPKLITRLVDWPLEKLLGRLLDHYLAAYASACRDDAALAAAKATLS